jgi:hypothetical protein
MKRFLVFAYDAYYPGGGWTDFQSDHDTLEEARAAAFETVVPWYAQDEPERYAEYTINNEFVMAVDTETGERHTLRNFVSPLDAEENT